MIRLTKLNGSALVINSDLIEFVESLPDSLITLTTGKKIMVKEKIPEIISAVVEFRQRINARGNGETNAQGTGKSAKSPQASPADQPTVQGDDIKEGNKTP